HMLWHWDVRQAKISEHIGYAAIEKHSRIVLPGQMIGANVPTEHQFGEQQWIRPGESVASDCYLILNNGSARFGCGCKTTLAQGDDDRALSRSGAAGDDVKPLWAIVCDAVIRAHGDAHGSPSKH